MNHENVWMKGILVKGPGKGPEAGKCLGVFKASQGGQSG